jgi:hypothetical protein
MNVFKVFFIILVLVIFSYQTSFAQVCVPLTECTEGFNCGTEDDGCSGTIECGRCDIGLICVDNICMVEEGCSPGFWKNNAGLDYNYKNGKDKKKQDDNCWCGGYTADTRLDTVFVNPPVPSDTMIDAINYGGKGGQVYNMLRHAVAALLNACSVDYPFSADEIINMVNDALADRDNPERGMSAVQGKLVDANESESEDTCIRGTCIKTGESCIDEPCKTYHNCPIDSHCNKKTTLPEWILFTTFDDFLTLEYPPSCGGN